MFRKSYIIVIFIYSIRFPFLVGTKNHETISKRVYRIEIRMCPSIVIYYWRAALQSVLWSGYVVSSSFFSFKVVVDKTMATYKKQSRSIRENYGHFYDFCFDNSLSTWTWGRQIVWRSLGPISFSGKKRLQARTYIKLLNLEGLALQKKQLIQNLHLKCYIHMLHIWTDKKGYNTVWGILRLMKKILTVIAISTSVWRIELLKGEGGSPCPMFGGGVARIDPVQCIKGNGHIGPRVDW